MVKNMEKLLKIECSEGVPKLKTDTIEVIPVNLRLNLTNIESRPEPGIAVHLKLDLDQLEDLEE